MWLGWGERWGKRAPWMGSPLRAPSLPVPEQPTGHCDGQLHLSGLSSKQSQVRGLARKELGPVSFCPRPSLLLPGTISPSAQ